MPVAVNCCFVPAGILAFAGVTVIDSSVVVTARVAEAETLPNAAIIVVVPAAMGVASPLEPAVLLIVATVRSDEVQVTDAVKFFAELSEYVPVAVNCWIIPKAMFALAGVMERETSVGDEDELDPPPPHEAAEHNNKQSNRILPDFMDIHSRRDQGRHIGPAVDTPHVAPFFDYDPVCFNLPAPSARHAGALLLRVPVFLKIGTEKLYQIGLDYAIPCYGEHDAGWGNEFPDLGRIGLDFLDGVAVAHSGRITPCRERLLICSKRVSRLPKRGSSVLGSSQNSREGKSE